jgi:hypothetical protein
MAALILYRSLKEVCSEVALNMYIYGLPIVKCNTVRSLG